MKIRYFFLSILVIGFACTNSDLNPDVPQNIIENSLTYFSGEVIEEGSGNVDGIDTWEIKIQSDAGSIVNFYWSVVAQVLVKMEGLTAPFDYELMPGNNLINYSTALTIAKTGVKNENIVRWELEEEEEFIDKWMYSFEFDNNGTTAIVYIDALNGDILQID